MRAEDFLAFEARMKERGLRRGALCAQLGVSQSKWRRIVDSPAGTEIDDKTLELACFALEGIAGFNQALDMAAQLIEENQIVDSSGGQTLAKRYEGNRNGLAYAEAIHALKR